MDNIFMLFENWCHLLDKLGTVLTINNVIEVFGY